MIITEEPFDRQYLLQKTTWVIKISCLIPARQNEVSNLNVSHLLICDELSLLLKKIVANPL